MLCKYLPNNVSTARPTGTGSVGRDVPLVLGALDAVRHFGPDGVKCLNTKHISMDSVTGDATGRPQETTASTAEGRWRNLE